MIMTTVPQIRLFLDPDGVVPPYAVVRHPSGYWYGVPGQPKLRLPDEDVKDAIPLEPGPSAVVDVRYGDDKPFGDGSLCDVDINGRPGARRVSAFVAGAFIVSTAAAKEGEPIMVRATAVKRGIELAPNARRLSAVPDSKG
jgi:hypothetical protein